MEQQKLMNTYSAGDGRKKKAYRIDMTGWKNILMYGNEQGPSDASV